MESIPQPSNVSSLDYSKGDLRCIWTAVAETSQKNLKSFTHLPRVRGANGFSTELFKYRTQLRRLPVKELMDCVLSRRWLLIQREFQQKYRLLWFQNSQTRFTFSPLRKAMNLSRTAPPKRRRAVTLQHTFFPAYLTQTTAGDSQL